MTQQQTPATRRGAPIGRPRGTGGPKRIPVTVRLLPSTDQRLTAAIAATGKRPQELVEEALNRYFDHLGQEGAQS